MAQWFADRKPGPRVRKGLRRIAVGDLNVAPLEHDVWSHKQLLKIVSHTPVEVDLFGRLQASLDWIDVPRRFVPEDEKLYSWWSYRNNDWRASNRGRRLDHILATPALSGAITQPSHRRRPARLEEGVGPRAGAGDVRGLRERSAWLSSAVLVIGLIVGLLARFITPGPNPRGILVTIVIGIVGSVIATYGGQALGLYQYGETAGFIGSVIGAVVLLVLLRLFSAGARPYLLLSR